MAVGSAFDQWRKDAFFPAAEAVQESADIMESLYRMWLGGRKDGFTSHDADELLKALHTAVGTAKWQLEDFARAVSLTHDDNFSSENYRITRHRQFIAAIGEQISVIEKEISDSHTKEGKQPLRWVQLNEEESDDLAMFLCAAPVEVKQRNTKCDTGRARTRTDLDSIHLMGSTTDIVPSCKDVNCITDKTVIELSEVVNKGEEMNGHRRALSSPDIASWKIVIADEECRRKSLKEKLETPKQRFDLSGFLKSVGSSARFRWFRNSFPKSKSSEPCRSRWGLSNYLNMHGVSLFTQGINKLNEKQRNCLVSCREDAKLSNLQQIGIGGTVERHIPGSHHLLQYGRSFRVTILLVLTIFLVVPFVLYST